MAKIPSFFGQKNSLVSRGLETEVFGDVIQDEESQNTQSFSEADSEYPDDNNEEPSFDSSNDFNFDDDSDNDSAFDDVGDKTGVFTNFAKFYLKLFGENVPYDKFIIPEGETYIGRKTDKCQIVLSEDDNSCATASA